MSSSETDCTRDRGFLNLPGVLSLLAIGIFAVGVGWWHYLTPPIHDDITYQYACLDTCEDDFWSLRGEEISTPSEAFTSAINHWKWVNGRLANILMILLVPAPAWLLALLQGLFAGVMAVFMFRFGLKRKWLEASWLCALVLLAIWKLLPWFEFFCSDDFSINYIWSCAIVLAFLWIMLHPRLLSSTPRIVGVCVLGIIGGMMHEGISLPVLAALCVLIFFPSLTEIAERPKDWRRRLAWPLCAFAVGTMLCALAPSTFARLARKDDSYASAGVVEMCKFFVRYLVPLYPYLMLCVVVWIKDGFRQLVSCLRGQVFWLIIIAGVCGMLVVLGFPASRMLLFTNVLLIILSLQLFGATFPGWLRPLKGLAVACIILQILFFWRLLSIQSELGKDLSDCISSFQQRADGRVFIDKRIDGNDVPWYTFGMLHDVRSASSTFYLQLVKTLPQYKRRHNVAALILPESMAEAEAFADIPKIEGDNPFRGKFPMVLSHDFLPPGTEIVVEYGDAYNFNPPWRKGKIRPGEGVLTVKECVQVPTFEPDTIYALFFNDPSGRMQVQAIKSLKY